MERNIEKEETAKMEEEEEEEPVKKTATMKEEEDPVEETAQSPSSESLANRNILAQEEGHDEVIEEEPNSLSPSESLANRNMLAQEEGHAELIEPEVILMQEPLMNQEEQEMSGSGTDESLPSTEELFYQFGRPLRINIEGVRRRNGKMAMGVVVRNIDGNLVAALSKNNDRRIHKDLEKPLALKHALLWWAEKGQHDDLLKVELTSVWTEPLVGGLDLPLWKLPPGYESIVKECCELGTKFQGMEFVRIEQDKNQVARSLAERALQMDRDEEWNADAPQWLLEAVRTMN